MKVGEYFVGSERAFIQAPLACAPSPKYDLRSMIQNLTVRTERQALFLQTISLNPVSLTLT